MTDFIVDLTADRLPGSARRAWSAFHGNRDDTSRYVPFQQRFADSVRDHPHRPAVADKAGILTYAELDQISEHLASKLVGRGVGPGVMIGVADYRDRETSAAVLSVMKAGGVLVPLNPRDPADRLRVVAADCGLAAVMASSKFAEDEQLQALDVPLMGVRLDDCRAGRPVGPAAHRSAGGDLAYVIYTSGSTGKPKGVRIRHDSLSNLVDWMLATYPIAPEDVVGVMSALYFDPSVQQMFPGWAAGSCVAPAPLELMLEPIELVEWLARRKVTHLGLVTAHWAGIISAVEQSQSRHELPDLRWLLVGGESMHYEQAARWHRALPGPAVIVNVYGPTEATVNATEYVVDDGETVGRVPIGFPLPGYRLYVVDAEGRLAAPYAVGELLIGGVGVAEGYTDPARTEAAFPLDPSATRPGARLYSTGDAARLVRGPREQWVIEFLGRQDGLVKIGGNRIELGEIEAVLQRSPELSQAAVVVIGDASAKSLLCLYVTRESDTASLEARLRARLASALPGYMVPHRYIRVPGLHYKASGKLDRDGLAEHYGARLLEGAPRSDDDVLPGVTAEAVAAVWGAALGRSRFTAADDYFALGGTSLLALEVVSALKRKCRVALRVADLYRYSTFGALCALVDARTGTVGSTESTTPPESKADHAAATSLAVRASSLDQSLGRLSLRLGAAQSLRLPTSAVCSGQSVEPEQDGFTTIHLQVDSHNVEAVCAAVGEVVRAHPLLRSTVDFSVTPPVHRVHAPATASLAVIESAPETAAVERDRLHAAAVRSWQSGTESPVRAAVQIVGDHIHLLLWISHAVCDGESQSILIGDLETVLRCGSTGDPGAPLEDRSPAYAGYVNALAELSGDSGAHEGTFAELCADRTVAAAVRVRERLTRSERNTSERTVTSWRRPTEAMAAVLCAFAGVLGLSDLPVLVEYHGRTEKYAMDVIGGLSTHVPALVGTAGGFEATEHALREQLSMLCRRHLDQIRAGRGAPAPTFLRISLFEQLEASGRVDFKVLDQPGEAANYGEHIDVAVVTDRNGSTVTISGQYDMSPVWEFLAATATDKAGI
jgi:nonribosomal peptide synthetase protein VioG